MADSGAQRPFKTGQYRTGPNRRRPQRETDGDPRGAFDAEATVDWCQRLLDKQPYGAMAAKVVTGELTNRMVKRV